MRHNYANPTAERQYRALLCDPARFPFVFTYGGRTHEGFGGLTFLSETVSSTDKRETTVKLFRADDTLLVKLEASFYPDYGVSEWTVRFRADGGGNTLLLEDPHTVLRFHGSSPVLKGILGDAGNQYRPYEKDLTAAPVTFVSESGRPTHGNFPYFNLEYGGGGAMLVIGWAGTWRADFVCSPETGETTYTARAVNGFSSYLKPGEEIRTALYVFAPYARRDEHYATNFWRSWMVTCNLPQNDASGRTVEPFSDCCFAGDTGLPNSDGSISERYYTWRPSLEKMFAEGIKVDVRWVDAGWYAAPNGTSPVSDWWGTIGTWTLDKEKWPGNTFRESTDYAKEHGMKTLLWFEPERVTDPESLAANYGYQTEWAIRREGIGSIANNIGIPACYDWTVGQITRTLRENRVDIYREDNNSNPAPLWRELDAREGEGRLGITECKFVDAHYRMWDDIIACTLDHGGCGFVDSCASGGGRNDLESMRRGVPLLRSDADRTTTSLRLSMTTAFNRWIPFCGASTKEKERELDASGRDDVYTWRASYLPALNVTAQFVQDPDQDFGILRFGLEEWRKVSPYLLKDMYVLTPWHSKDDRTGFTAYLFYDGEAERGALFLFRMEDCEEDRLTVTLPSVAFTGTYRLKDEDSGEIWLHDAEKISFCLPEKRFARLVWVSKA